VALGAAVIGYAVVASLVIALRREPA
jgi:hypothetical protein